MKHIWYYLVSILILVSPLACSDGTGETSEATGAASTSSAPEETVTVSSYFNTPTSFRLYLQNPGTEPVTVSAASFKTGSNSHSLSLMGWKLSGQDRVDSAVFTHAVLSAGGTVTFFMQFLPTTPSPDSGLFQVYYTLASGREGVLAYEISGTVIPGTPPTPPATAEAECPEDEEDEEEEDGDGDSGNGGTGGSTEVAATELKGELRLKIAKSYAYLPANTGKPLLGSQDSTYVDIVLDPDQGSFEMEAITEDDGFLIPTGTSTFNKQSFTVTSTTGSGRFTPTDSLMTLEDVKFTIHAEDVGSLGTKDDANVFELAFVIDLTTAETVDIEEEMNAANVTGMTDTFGTHFISETPQKLKGQYPDANQTVFFVGFSKMNQEDIVADDFAKSLFKSDPWIYLMIEGRILER